MNDASSNEVLMRARESMAGGRLEDARSLARRVCEDDAGSVDGWLLLGSLNGQLQAYDEAIDNYSTAVELAPLDARGHAGLTNAFYAAGRLEEAIRSGRQLLEVQPGNPENWYLLATIYWMHEDHDDSASCLRHVIELMPTHAVAHRSLGYMLQLQGRLDDALESYRHAVACKPDFADAYNDIGVVLQEKGQASEAMSAYNKALQSRPDFIDARMNLGNLLLVQFDVEAAEKCFRHVLSVEGENPKALCGLGTSLLEQGKTEDAYACFRKALDLDPGFEDATVKIARMYERQGNYDDALSLLQPVVDRGVNADAAAAFALLGPRVQMVDRAITVLEDMLQKGNPTYAQKTEMYFSLGRLYDKIDDYDAAFRNFETGNRLKAVNYSIGRQVSLVDSLVSTYSRENMAALESASTPARRPVFIVGMPRSGTSLAEQILAVHPEVQAAGELIEMNRIAATMHQAIAGARPYPAGALSLGKDAVERLSRTYLGNLPVEGRDKPFFTDKMPHNFLHLGLIQQLFPNARVIHCVRDARDTCLSCYTYDFRGEHPYAYDLRTLGEYYNQYKRLMRHWKTVLDLPIYDLEYEKLIADQERGMRKLVSFCGLDWDDRCLGFHESGRFVLTSSYDQVRRPIYSSSIGRWKHYQRHIQPLLDALEQEK